MTLFSIKRRGLMLVLSSPSGAGKTSIARELLAIDDNLEMSVSATTRPRRPGEVHGVGCSRDEAGPDAWREGDGAGGVGLTAAE